VPNVSVVIPALDEEGAVAETVSRVRKAFAGTAHEIEIIVVDDGSTDRTGEFAAEAGAQVYRHPLNIGYGNAIITGSRHANHELIAITDADGTYPVEELPAMVDDLVERNLDMIVGARRGKHYESSLIKSLARKLFRVFAEFVAGCRIPDINSGLRVMRRGLIDKYWPIASGGFSFSTTVTVVSLLTSHFVDYVPIDYFARSGSSSKVHHLRDSLRAAQILVMAVLLYNPIKPFLVLAGVVLVSGLVGLALCALLPGAASIVLLCSIYWLTTIIVISLGFIAEQKRVALALADSRQSRTRDS
jgi:glycosyltransferase involved in cell wall biosynthesis